MKKLTLLLSFVFACVSLASAQTLVLNNGIKGSNQEFRPGPAGVIIHNLDGTDDRIGKDLIGGSTIGGAPTGVANGSQLVSNGVSQQPLYQTKLASDMRDFGAACNDSTDDTTALSSALTFLYNQGGGTLTIPPGVLCLISGQITIPHNSVALQQQPSIRITSSSGSFKTWGQLSFPSFGGLDLRFNATQGKILSIGFGSLEIDHLTLADKGSDCAAFIYDTLTTVNIHDNSFIGTAVSASACNDAVVLGGTDTSVSNAVTSAFAGYGSVVENNFFSGIQRGILGQVFVNGVQIVDNTWDVTCGGTAHGAIEITGGGATNDIGNYIAGNLIELPFYLYGMWFTHAAGNTIVGNSLFDVGTNLVGYRFESTGSWNYVVDATNAAPTKISDASGSNTFLTSDQSITSIIPQPWKFVGGVFFNNPATGNVSVTGPTWSDGDLNEFQVTTTPSSANPQWIMNYFPNGGSERDIFDIVNIGTTSTQFNIPSSNTTTFRNALGDLKVESNAGNNLWLGDTTTVTTRITGANFFTAGQINSTIVTGTTPFVVASTTPVANLTLSNHPQVYEAGVLTTAEKLYTNTQALTSGTATHTLANSFTFTSSATFQCQCTDRTAAAACQALPASPTTVTLAGTGADVLALMCSGH